MMATTRTLAFSVLIGLCLSSSSLDLAAQQARQPQRVDPMTAGIKGLVTAADTGAPLGGAEVRLSSRGAYNRLATTDAEGLFTLRDLPAGEYRLTVSRSGFTTLAFGQRRPLESPATIELSEGETFTANIALTRGGVVFGRVVDQFGEPIAGTRVQVLRSRMVQGQRRLQSMGPGDQTDDTGAFRVHSLPPGDYYVAASTGPVNAVKRNPPIYYPGTPSFAEAQTLSVAAGADVSADFQLAPLPNVTVSGIVLDSSGAPVEAMVNLASEAVGMAPALDGSPTPPAMMLAGDSGPDGKFIIENVPPGPYTLNAMLPFSAGMVAGLEARAAANARAPMTREQRLKAMEDVRFHMPETASTHMVVGSEDLSGITLTTGRGAMLTGTFVADAGVARQLPTGLRAEVRSARSGGGMSMMQGGLGNEFRVAGMSGPFHLSVGGLPEGWAVSRITMDGADVTDAPIDLRGRDASVRVVLTDRVTSVSGVVQSRREPSDYTVLVFPDDSSKWMYPTRYVEVTRADERGRFRIAGLPPNDRYYAVALDFLEQGEEHDPQLLDRLRGRAMTFSLGDGEQRSIYLEGVVR